MFKKSFTIIEALITIAISAVVLTAFLNVYLAAQKLYSQAETQAELLQNGRIILERLGREVRQAREIATTLAEQESEATSSLVFEDGHIEELYHYIHYFQDDTLMKREVLGYYFSGDVNETLVPFDAVPPPGQTLETKILEPARIIGEYVDEIKIWNPGLVKIILNLNKGEQAMPLQTQIFGRNL